MSSIPNQSQICSKPNQKLGSCNICHQGNHVVVELPDLYSWVQVLVRVGSPEVVPSEGVRALGCFPNLRRESMDSTGTWPHVNNCLLYGNVGNI